MKQTKIVDRTILVLLLGTLCATASNSFAQQAKPTKASTPQTSQSANSKLSLEQELALSLIRRLADEVKGEADKPGAATSHLRMDRGVPADPAVGSLSRSSRVRRRRSVPRSCFGGFRASCVSPTTLERKAP